MQRICQAVSLLCGIEGIPCYKIKGASGKGSELVNPVYAQHAWNKVYIIDGNWYVLDRVPGQTRNINLTAIHKLKRFLNTTLCL